MSLTLSENSFTGTIPTQVGHLTSLSEWYMASNQMSGGLPTELGKVTEMSGDLELQYNSIGDNGAKALAEALKFNAVITELNLRGNPEIGEEAEKALQEAAEARPGLELQL